MCRWPAEREHRALTISVKKVVLFSRHGEPANYQSPRERFGGSVAEDHNGEGLFFWWCIFLDFCLKLKYFPAFSLFAQNEVPKARFFTV